MTTVVLFDLDNTIGYFTPYKKFFFTLSNNIKMGAATLELIEYINPKAKAEGLKPCSVGTFHLSLEVDDIYKTIEELQKKGVEFTSAPNISGGEFEGWVWAYFKDPDGHQLELVENRVLKHPL